MSHDFTILGVDGTITVGLHDDGSPGEVFIKISKQGSTISGLYSTIGVLWSLALQYGVPSAVIIGKLKGMRFEPMDFQAQSIIDYLAKWFDAKFGDRAA